MRSCICRTTSDIHSIFAMATEGDADTSLADTARGDPVAFWLDALRLRQLSVRITIGGVVDLEGRSFIADIMLVSGITYDELVQRIRIVVVEQTCAGCIPTDVVISLDHVDVLIRSRADGQVWWTQQTCRAQARPVAIDPALGIISFWANEFRELATPWFNLPGTDVPRGYVPIAKIHPDDMDETLRIISRVARRERDPVPQTIYPIQILLEPRPDPQGEAMRAQFQRIINGNAGNNSPNPTHPADEDEREATRAQLRAILDENAGDNSQNPTHPVDEDQREAMPAQLQGIINGNAGNDPPNPTHPADEGQREVMRAQFQGIINGNAGNDPPNPTYPADEDQREPFRAQFQWNIGNNSPNPTDEYQREAMRAQLQGTINGNTGHNSPNPTHPADEGRLTPLTDNIECITASPDTSSASRSVHERGRRARIAPSEASSHASRVSLNGNADLPRTDAASNLQAEDPHQHYGSVPANHFVPPDGLAPPWMQRASRPPLNQLPRPPGPVFTPWGGFVGNWPQWQLAQVPARVEQHRTAYIPILRQEQWGSTYQKFWQPYPSQALLNYGYGFLPRW
ncbi:hypothetical protein C8R45DRAFT_1012860 [Mycena sanguinolenta]|nr:hypothetical protein C8R45DRAFT_1012860 [Mycena sanguinolenta]